MDWSTALQEYRTYLMSVQFAAGSIRVHSSYLRRLALEQRRGPWSTSTKDLRRLGLLRESVPAVLMRRVRPERP